MQSQLPEYQKQFDTINQNLEEKFQEYETFKQLDYKFQKTYFQTYQTKQGELMYIHKGEILQKFQIYEFLPKLEIITNLEQIKYLRWIGELGKDNRKIGLWKATWKGESIVDCGGWYSQEGQKQGKWKEMIKNYNDHAKVFEIGEYVNDLRKGIWKYNFQENEIGGGEYNEKGFKQGKWIELSERFRKNSQVTYIGEYNRNGQKVGKWDIMFCPSNQYEQIGGGQYDELQEGCSIKVGKWIELWDGFQKDSQVTQNGEYNTNGMKIGRWNIMYNNQDKEQIGGGLYHEQQDCSVKTGRWLELSEGFQRDSQVTYYGEYNKNGMKVGRWDIMYKKKDIYGNEDPNYQLIGCGSYQDQQDGSTIKIGKWIELWDNFRYPSQITFNGEYNINGIKIGKWDIMYCKWNEKEYQQIGGGEYDELEGDSIKIGKWVEVQEDFFSGGEITSIGEYNKRGIKVGRWDIWFKKNYGDAQNEKIGGGQYCEQAGGFSIKIGKWIEQLDEFYDASQIVYIGEYNTKGIKISRWDIMFRQYGDFEFKQIGGGSYFEQEGGASFKIGKWVEFCEQYKGSAQVTYNGEFNMKGQKIGKWDIMFDRWGNGDFKQIGGGQYEEQEGGSSIKIGRWVELYEGFCDSIQITYTGEYNEKGIKNGTWVETDLGEQECW
ncbi:unnamed protein product [Paramecium sonneborni]|uniref:Uncharacterized protein n=1 Tax=Paramecium sonneborni TaxID=65129 RepID=A0A8S1PZN1_9CILI|nr:unnamed protein product [Paramecium sonneborni]